jgi:ABC-type transport system involved in multi-copper enzyme maturation permease subunit
MPPLLLWAQQAPAAAGQPQAPPAISDTLWWLLVWGEPGVTDERWFGGLITWAKVVGLFSLLAWVLVYVVNTLRASTAEGRQRGTGALGKAAAFLGVIAVLFLGSVLLQVLEQTGRVRLPKIGLGQGGAIGVAGALATGLGIVLALWAEAVLWWGLARRREPGPLVLAGALHLVLALGLVVGFLLPSQFIQGLFAMEGLWRPDPDNPVPPAYLTGWSGHVLQGLRLGATYAGLVVLLYLGVKIAGEATHLRWRRLYAIAWQTVVEAYRRMWAPWVVLALFVIFLAFTGWFLRDQRVAELAKLYVGSLSLVISLLLTLMILILAPISIPNDIRQQTIYTVVTKPVRRLEVIWGRMLGYMALVTVVVLVFGGISLGYLERVVRRQVDITREKAVASVKAGRVDEAKQLSDAADQLANRMSARLPIEGSLVFTDSRGTKRTKGIDVGMEMASRSHIEGATPSRATWRFGPAVEDPLRPGVPIDRAVPVEQLLVPGTIEDVENRLVLAQQDLRAGQGRGGDQGEASGSQRRTSAGDRQRLEGEVKTLTAQLDALRREEADLKKAGKADEASKRLHSPNIPIEMTFNVYRTTKGELGEAVRASVVVTNPLRPELPRFRLVLPIREYYTIRQSFPASMLAGSRGNLVIEVQCITPNQFLGMAENDLYILAAQGAFWTNYLRGLSGIWLQTLVLSAVGLFAGTFLSWPVAFVLTLAFYGAGQLAVGFLHLLVSGTIRGGGPFESLIRLLGHDNQVNDLAPTFGVVIAKTFDQILMPILTQLSYLIPNLSYLDVSNQVALGFAVTDATLLSHVAQGFGYAIPFTVAAYLILKNREVAA